MMMKPSELLARTQEVLLERGLAKDVSIRPFGPEVCTGGALALAGGAEVTVLSYEQFRPFYHPEGNSISDVPNENREALLRAITYFNVSTGCPLVSLWNDEPERTLEEVLDALHRAEIMAKEAGE